MTTAFLCPHQNGLRGSKHFVGLEIKPLLTICSWSRWRSKNIVLNFYDMVDVGVPFIGYYALISYCYNRRIIIIEILGDSSN